jgi:hypothetical protein
VFLTRPPRKPSEEDPVRLACIRHAASVDPEPGSNSPPLCFAPPCLTRPPVQSPVSSSPPCQTSTPCKEVFWFCVPSCGRSVRPAPSSRSSTTRTSRPFRLPRTNDLLQTSARVACTLLLLSALRNAIPSTANHSAAVRPKLHMPGSWTAMSRCSRGETPSGESSSAAKEIVPSHGACVKGFRGQFSD